MIMNTKQLIKRLDVIGDLKIRQGIEFKRIADTINFNQDKKKFKEWLAFSRKILDLDK